MRSTAIARGHGADGPFDADCRTTPLAFLERRGIPRPSRRASDRERRRDLCLALHPAGERLLGPGSALTIGRRLRLVDASQRVGDRAQPLLGRGDGRAHGDSTQSTSRAPAARAPV